jgi:two-component SAPR family response regulator
MKLSAFFVALLWQSKVYNRFKDMVKNGLIIDNTSDEERRLKMIFFLVDINKKSLEILSKCIKEIFFDAIVIPHLNPDTAYENAIKVCPDWFITEVELGNRDGISLAKKVKKECPKIHCGIMNDSNEYMEDAWKIHVQAYFQKPITTDMLRNYLIN